uniref:C-type lectin domain-containing protein n=1 Tax=Acrobeloides nanus TaxID=290746 RepID=A0A914C8K5_9BILA
MLSICQDLSNSVPLALTSQEKYDFIEEISYAEYSYNLGLHRNKQNKWVWFDYDGSELPLGNFTKWAPGYNENSSGDCVALLLRYLMQTFVPMYAMGKKLDQKRTRLLQ